MSALGFLIIGGTIAIRVLPPLLERFFFARSGKENHGSVGVVLMFLFLFAMMPATHYASASYRMGAFLSGLVFCGKAEVKAHYTSQFKRIQQWLMRIFFAASIGFQVPTRDFGDGRVIAVGFIYSLAFSGKFAVGFMTPNFGKGRRYRGNHLRDCLITGCSMAAEAEFAFIVALFGKDQNLFSDKLYASIVFAIVLSAIFAPFALQLTILYWNKVDELQITEPNITVDENGELQIESDQIKRTISDTRDLEELRSLDHRARRKGSDEVKIQN